MKTPFGNHGNHYCDTYNIKEENRVLMESIIKQPENRVLMESIIKQPERKSDSKLILIDRSIKYKNLLKKFIKMYRAVSAERDKYKAKYANTLKAYDALKEEKSIGSRIKTLKSIFKIGW